MTYAETLARMKTILDRDDCTDALARIFLADGMTRLTRDLRVPSMERALLVTADDFPLQQITVPTDLIQIVDLMVPMEGSQTGELRALKRLAYRALMALPNTATPYAYARFQQQIYLRGAVPVDTQVQVLYYGNFTAFADDDDTNEITASMPDVATYAALGYAGDHFQHPLTASWKASYQELKAAIIAMGIDLENEGGVAEMEPLYPQD